MKVAITSLICLTTGHFAVHWKPKSDFSERTLIPTQKNSQHYLEYMYNCTTKSVSNV